MTAGAAADLLMRLDAVEARLASLAVESVGGLTDADPATGERWDAGQVWAHLAEFPGYWLGQARLVVERWRDEPVPFGRVKTDPERLAAIENERMAAPSLLLDRVHAQLDALRSWLRELPGDAWDAVGLHVRLGEMGLARTLDEFVVGHLEEHAAQLEGMAGRG
ncbi:MAG: DinB family protein [Chloroflexi bacterium]|nr:MAG: DinB family protein [Chloroflexota bacterium]